MLNGGHHLGIFCTNARRVWKKGQDWKNHLIAMSMAMVLSINRQR